MTSPPSVLPFLFVLHLLLCGAYGARLGKLFVMKSATSNSQLANLVNNENDVKKQDDQINTIFGVEVKSKDDENHSSSQGKSRKLITSTTISTSPSAAKHIQQNLNNGGKKMVGVKRDDKAQKLSSTIHGRNPSTAFDVDNKHKEIAPPEYENAMDMTVMDYSPAKRKPPIHN